MQNNTSNQIFLEVNESGICIFSFYVVIEFTKTQMLHAKIHNLARQKLYIIVIKGFFNSRLYLGNTEERL